MTKKYQFLQIFTVITLGITAILGVFLGLQAINKSLNLNLAFNSNPIIYCEISIKGENDTQFAPIFNNSATNPQIGAGVQLSGNKLTINKDYSNTFGNNFVMTIKNLEDTESAIYITPSNASLTNASTEATISNILLIPNETSVEMKVSTTGAITLNMTKTHEFSLSNAVGVDIDASGSNLIYHDSKYYVNPSAENVVVKFKNLDGYTENITLSNLTINGQSSSNYSFDSATNTLTISKEYASGNIIWSGAAEVLTTITLTLNFTGHGTMLYNPDVGGNGYLNLAYGDAMQNTTYSNTTDASYYLGSSYVFCNLPQSETKATFSLELEPNKWVVLWGYAGISSQCFIRILSVTPSISETYFTNNWSNGSNVGMYFKTPSINTTITITTQGVLDLCFIPGTQVYTENGYKNIEDIKTGDMVWTLNEETNQFELKEVLYPTRNYYTDEVATIVVGGQEITATSGHTFLTQNRGWVAIKYLTQDDILWGFEQDIQITSSSVSTYEGYVYNLHLKDNHNYMVGVNKVVVHNAGVPC